MPAPKPSSQPSRRQAAISLPASSRRHLDSALRRVGTWHRIVEEHHDAVTGELVECSFELAHQWPQRAVVFAQEVEHHQPRGTSKQHGQEGVTRPGAAPARTRDVAAALRAHHLTKCWQATRSGGSPKARWSARWREPAPDYDNVNEADVV